MPLTGIKVSRGNSDICTVFYSINFSSVLLDVLRGLVLVIYKRKERNGISSRLIQVLHFGAPNLVV